MNKKKLFTQIFSSFLTLSLLTGCGGNPTTTNSKFERIDTDLKVGMVIGTGTIDDRSFNQGSWEGITETVAQSKYIIPTGETESDYLAGIANLYEAGYTFIVTPGYYFETADYVAQTKYPDANFVILDGTPRNAAGEVFVAENTVSIFFAEHEAGFVAGVAAAVEIGEGDFGFLGGMPIPAVTRFETGFRQGINYANTHLGTHITLDDINIVYQGTFGDKAAGQQIAAQMYDRGVQVIFTAAGGTGMGAISEAKSRAGQDQKVWVIGVDSDQYEDGIYDREHHTSVVLTSAIKYVDQATHDMIIKKVEGNFPGGETLTYTIINDGVGIPLENPNLSETTLQTIQQIYSEVKAGNLTISASLS